MRDFDALLIVYHYKAFARLKYFLELGYSEQDWKDSLKALQERKLVTKSGALSSEFKNWHGSEERKQYSSMNKAIKEKFFSTELEKALQ
jgi:hypothetical protein